MINEDYCSYEVAKLLKEKGFNYQGFDYIDFEGEVIKQDRPTHQKAMKWLREVHQLHISVDVCPIYGKAKDEKGRNTCSLLYWHYMASGEWLNEKHDPFKKAFVVSEKSHKQAVEAALKYCLENLI